MTSEENKQAGPVSITVFFPCYNEQDNVGRVTDKAVEVLEGMGADYEVIIVNDGSSDNTRSSADSLADKYPHVRAIHHETNQGYGAALQSGFRAASKELVFYTDGDGQFDLAELSPLIPLLENADIVSCYRLKRQDNLMRKINGFAWSKLGCILFRMNVRDIDCAFKLYRREIFNNIEMHSTGALIDTEILARAVKKGYKIVQTGVHHYPRTAGEQTGANVRVIFRAFKELFKLRSQINKTLK